jgi:hypothetical protein
MIKIIYDENNPSGIEIDGLPQDKDIYLSVGNAPGKGFTDPNDSSKYLYYFDLSDIYYSVVFDKIVEDKINEGLEACYARDFAIKFCPRVTVTTPKLQRGQMLPVDKSTAAEAGNYPEQTLLISNQYIIDWMFDEFGVPKELCTIIPM